MRGGKRPEPASPNMLGRFLNPESATGDRFSPLVWAHLNSAPPDSRNGTTRRQLLIEHWKKAGVLTVNLNNPKQSDRLAVYGPNYKPSCENLKLITNRIKMLHDVHTEVETADRELADTLKTIN
jgi:hypothetical protein